MSPLSSVRCIGETRRLNSVASWWHCWCSGYSHHAQWFTVETCTNDSTLVTMIRYSKHFTLPTCAHWKCTFIAREPHIITLEGKDKFLGSRTAQYISRSCPKWLAKNPKHHDVWRCQKNPNECSNLCLFISSRKIKYINFVDVTKNF